MFQDMGVVWYMIDHEFIFAAWVSKKRKIYESLPAEIVVGRLAYQLDPLQFFESITLWLKLWIPLHCLLVTHYLLHTIGNAITTGSGEE